MSMMLRSIKIYGLFEEYDYSIELCGGRLTFIHSQNGYGKSTLMRLIYNVLEGNLKEVASTPFERMDLGFDDDTFLIVENNESGLLIQMQRNLVEEELSEDDLNKVLNVTYMPPERMTIMKGGCLTPALKVYLDDLTSKMKDATENCELEKVPKEGRKQYSDDELEFWCKDLKAKLEFIKQAGFEPDMPPGYRFPPTRYEIMEYREDYTELAFSMDDYVKRYYTLAESLIVYMDIVNNFFVNKGIYVNESGILTAKMDNGTMLPISKLSSGEKQILVIFYRLLFQTPAGSLAIIDEPEISLHVSWQQMMGKMFTDVAKLRSLYIIVATHSPQIIHDGWDHAVELKPENVR
jgi:ABC-type transport system involved in cytochrome c biogenesis ATPase subunit